MEWISTNWTWVAFTLFPAIVTVASIIAKATTNETDNKIVGVLLKVVDFAALTTGKTKINTDKIT